MMLKFGAGFEPLGGDVLLRAQFDVCNSLLKNFGHRQSFDNDSSRSRAQLGGSRRGSVIALSPAPVFVRRIRIAEDFSDLAL